jgi:hypothetical protein
MDRRSGERLGRGQGGDRGWFLADGDRQMAGDVWSAAEADGKPGPLILCFDLNRDKVLLERMYDGYKCPIHDLQLFTWSENIQLHLDRI